MPSDPWPLQRLKQVLALLKTAWNMGLVSRPVNVFC